MKDLKETEVKLSVPCHQLVSAEARTRTQSNYNHGFKSWKL
jgi:hypothetical protein